MDIFTILTIFLFAQQSLAIKIVPRNGWGANPPKEHIRIPGKLPYVIIHHSYSPAACYTPESCKKAMKSMQNFHQNDRGWADIGYSFGIGGDGNIYEGRGFKIVGAHAPGYNDKSVGICLIGDWTKSVPPKIMLDKAQELIDYGISNGYITSDYKLYGHRQVRDTDCPGDMLFKEIQKWPHFSNKVTK